MIFTRDFVTRENHWQITSLVTKKIVIHDNSCITLYFLCVLAIFLVSQTQSDLMRLVKPQTKVDIDGKAGIW